MKTTKSPARTAKTSRPAARTVAERAADVDDEDDDFFLPPSTRRNTIGANACRVDAATVDEPSILDAPDAWRYPSTLPADVSDVVSDETIEAIRAAFADDLAYLVDVEPTQISDLARSLWDVARWDLPVTARVELNALAQRYGEDVGFLAYAAPVLADPIRLSNYLPFGDIARSVGLDEEDAARVARAMHVFERRCLEAHAA